MARYGTVLHLSDSPPVEQIDAEREVYTESWQEELSRQGMAPKPETARMFYAPAGSETFMDCPFARPCGAAHIGISMEALA
jgi:hypothetical protein